MLSRRVYIAGGSLSRFVGKGNPHFIDKKHPDFQKKENPTLKDYVQQPVGEVFSQLNIDGSVVDRGFIGNFTGELFNKQGHLGSALAGSHPTMNLKPCTRVEGACASGGLAVLGAVDAIQAGADVVLVSGVEVQNTASARDGADFLARASDYDRQRSLDEFTFPAMFARRTKALVEAGVLTEEDINAAVLKAYSNGNKNPLAHMQAMKMTAEKIAKSPTFLGNQDLHPFLRVSQCSQVSDGGAAMIMVSEAGMEKINAQRSSCTELKAFGHACGNLYEDGPSDELVTTKTAAARAYQMAGLGPKDMGVSEVHDCFAVNEILMYEALGFAEKHQGAKFLKSGATEIDGAQPCNTGGGLVAFGHPVGATGLKQLLEIHRQMKGQCGDYQMKSSPQYGITANMGGDDKTAVVTILEN